MIFKRRGVGGASGARAGRGVRTAWAGTAALAFASAAVLGLCRLPQPGGGGRTSQAAPATVGTASTPLPVGRGSIAAGDPLAFLERLPASVEAVVLIESGAKQAGSEPGRALAAAVREARSFADLVKAWDGLARTLEWTGDRTFEALLGRRAALAMSGLETRFQWVLTSAIDAAASQRLRDRLKPAPRGLVAGRVVLAVEDGGYELALTPGPADMPGAVTLVLAPARHSGLFDQVVRAATGGGEPLLAGSPAFAAAANVGVGDVFILHHRDLLAGRKDPLRRAHYLLASARLNKSGWSATLRASPGVLMDREKTRNVAPWPGPVMERLSQGAVLLALGLGPAEATRVLRLDALAEALKRDTALSGLLAQRWMLGVWTGLCGDPGAHGAMTVAVAVDTPDVPALAVEGDRVMTLLTPLLTAAPPAPGDTGFGGMFPSAVRTARSPRRVSEGADAPVRALSWGYPPSPVPMPPGSDAGADPGWWVVSLTVDGGACAPLGGGETSLRWVRDLSSALRANPAVPGDKGFLSMGLVRPGELAALLRASGLDDTGALAPLRWLRSISWKTWPAGEFIEGGIEVEVAENPGPKRDRGR